jgi:ketosteroid isomerase-like protein
MTPKELFIEALRRSDAGDHEGFLDLQADDAHWIVPGTIELQGKHELRGWLGVFWQAFGSYRHEITSIENAGSAVFAEGTWTGIHDGPLLAPDGEVPPTGRTASFRWAIALEIDESAGVARSVRLYYDQLEFLAQLGLVPEPAAA